ncbi:hypothetical protein BST61_g6120 [Cercospora zeina]
MGLNFLLATALPYSSQNMTPSEDCHALPVQAESETPSQKRKEIIVLILHWDSRGTYWKSLRLRPMKGAELRAFFFFSSSPS